ncbi:MAG: secretin and TonB N-terminal domain-containing protein, partial [Prevotella sp.]|nr:secretin and TonB N-terminal domain-containing protein [Prevotella sp.]
MQHCKTKKRVLQLSLAILLGLAPLSFPTTAKAETTQVKSDRVTLSLQNVSVEQMFSQIKKQTGYNFVISSELSKNLRRVSVTANNEAVKSVLERVLNPLNCTFDIDGRVITIYRKLSDNRNRTISGYV